MPRLYELLFADMSYQQNINIIYKIYSNVYINMCINKFYVLYKFYKQCLLAF